MTLLNMKKILQGRKMLPIFKKNASTKNIKNNQIIDF